MGTPTLTNTRTKGRIITNEIPKHEADRLARATLKAVEAYFALPGVQEDFEKWLIEYKKREATGANENQIISNRR